MECLLKEVPVCDLVAQPHLQGGGWDWLRITVLTSLYHDIDNLAVHVRSKY